MPKRWLLLDYGGVLADDHIPSGELCLAQELRTTPDILRSTISEKSDLGRAIRLDQLSEGEFWTEVSFRLNGSRTTARPAELTRMWSECYSINLGTIHLVKHAQNIGMRVAIATNVDRYRALHMENKVKEHISDVTTLSSFNLNFMKPDINYYKAAESCLLQMDGDSRIALYLDDRKEHIESATKAGWTAVAYDNSDAQRKMLQQVLSETTGG